MNTCVLDSILFNFYYNIWLKVNQQYLMRMRIILSLRNSNVQLYNQLQIYATFDSNKLDVSILL